MFVSFEVFLMSTILFGLVVIKLNQLRSCGPFSLSLERLFVFAFVRPLLERKQPRAGDPARSRFLSRTRSDGRRLGSDGDGETRDVH